MISYRIVITALAAGALLHAASPTAWEMTSYQDFLEGRFTGVSLRQDGRLTLAPRLDTLFSPEEPAVWSIAALPGGAYVLGTGHRGRVYRVDATGASQVLFTAPEPEIFAVATDSAGRIYAASSPQGKVYRIENGQATEFFTPAEAYVWSLAVAPDGSLFVGTGNTGKIFRVNAQGQGEVYYDTGQSHVTSLMLDQDNHLIAGTEPNGIVYRIEAKDKAFVLYDADLPEIRALAAAPGGGIYVAAMGGSISGQQPITASVASAALSNTSAPSTAMSITVTDQQAGAEIRPQASAAGAAQAMSPAMRATSVVETAGVEKSAIYRIRPDNTVEKLWSSKEENAYDMAVSGSDVLFSTDGQGRLYRMSGGSQATLVAETSESEVLRLLPDGDSTIVATGNQGKLLRLGATQAPEGEFVSPVHDASTVARWGKLSWMDEPCPGCSITFRTRTGNSARPDKTWSDWSQPLADAQGSPVSSPNARFFQWKAELRGDGRAAPALDSVRLAYLPQNAKPAVKSVTVSAQVAAAATTPAAAAASNSTYSITVTDTGDMASSSSSGTSTQPVTRASNEQLLFSWQGEDSDGDRLVYDIYFRGVREREWMLLKGNLTASNYTLDAETLADGRYVFRVVASDRLVNPPGQAEEGELVSSPVLVDRTPPTVTLSPQAGAGAVVVTAADAASPLVSCDYSVNAGPWTPVAPDDGILDSPSERFTIHPGPGTGSERLLVVRVRDSANNAGLAKIVLP